MCRPATSMSSSGTIFLIGDLSAQSSTGVYVHVRTSGQGPCRATSNDRDPCVWLAADREDVSCPLRVITPRSTPRRDPAQGRRSRATGERSGPPSVRAHGQTQSVPAECVTWSQRTAELVRSLRPCPRYHRPPTRAARDRARDLSNRLAPATCVRTRVDDNSDGIGRLGAPACSDSCVVL